VDRHWFRHPSGFRSDDFDRANESVMIVLPRRESGGDPEGRVMGVFRKILVPVDLSRPSQLAFRAALGLARDHGARVIVLYIDRPPCFVREHSPQLYDRLHESYPSDGSVAVEYQVHDGDPVLEILRADAAEHCDLIALGTHEQTGFQWLLDSVTRKILLGARCPVMTLSCRADGPSGAAVPVGEGRSAKVGPERVGDAPMAAVQSLGNERANSSE
jgi:nucleotide-binding universal stress UspA family protein